MIRAIVFDFDGLILDTESVWYSALTEIFADYGGTIPLDVYGQIIGTSNEVFDVFDYLAEQTGRPFDKTMLRQEHVRRFRRGIEAVRVRDGIESYIAEARRLGLKIGLATSSSRAWIEQYLPQAGLSTGDFDAISTSDDVERVKPDPSLYLRTLRLLGVDPQEAVAFEDSPNGAKAAKAAGMYCVVVPNSVTGRLVFGDVDMRIRSMAERSLPDVLKQLTAKSC